MMVVVVAVATAASMGGGGGGDGGSGGGGGGGGGGGAALLGGVWTGCCVLLQLPLLALWVKTFIRIFTVTTTPSPTTALTPLP